MCRILRCIKDVCIQMTEFKERHKTHECLFDSYRHAKPYFRFMKKMCFTASLAFLMMVSRDIMLQSMKTFVRCACVAKVSSVSKASKNGTASILLRSSATPSLLCYSNLLPCTHWRYRTNWASSVAVRVSTMNFCILKQWRIDKTTLDLQLLFFQGESNVENLKP